MRLLSFYGDDFTGSTDVMEALATHGVKTVLFTRRPSADEMSAFEDCAAIGLAGTSRSETPAWMDEHLPGIFSWLKSLEARFSHYKVCSTFDSSPAIGNIGRAVEIGRDVFGQDLVPLVVGAPQLKRYTAFGNLFAGYQGETYRIDRHPVMSRHPVTPMPEADLRLHLAQQTQLPVSLVPLTALGSATPDVEVDACLAHCTGMALFDVIDRSSQCETGRQLLRLAGSGPVFVAGSSGIEYALLPVLAERREIECTTRFAALPAVERIMVVSGSCSPTTSRQIRHALGAGFAGIEVDPVRLAAEPQYQIEIIADAGRLLGQGHSVVAYTALDGGTKGTELDAIPGGRHAVGEALGNILRDAARTHQLSRVIIAGGDTSSHALGQLDAFALTTRFPLKQSPGSPLCVGHSSDPAFDGIEIAMKGGQVGADDYFTMLRDGITG
ncbi:MAG: four-carbon acid sugar kinase family protein [Alphaproteobacteria bacterium]|nr:four-carbon acid sugar kinase family protein [Alphaproteobacteria bacterium]